MGSRLYISKRTGLIALGIFLIGLVGLGVGLLFLFNKTVLTTPEEEYQPLDSLTLNNVAGTPTPVHTKIAQAEIKGVASSLNPGKNTQPKKLTIIFFYDGYDVQGDALGAVEVMKASLDIVEPFKSLKELIDFKVFTTDGKKCKVDDKSHLLVCNKQLIESFRKLGVDHFKVVLMSPDLFGSTAPLAYGKNSWISISTSHTGEDNATYKRSLGLEFTNLLAHSLGLKYEYSKADKVPDFPQPPPGVVVTPQSLGGRPNCAPDLDTAKIWWGGYSGIFPGRVGFNKGCGWDKDAYYPEQNTLMSDEPKKEGYGIVSEDYLRGVLTCFYGEEEKMIFPAGGSASESARMSTACSAFTKDYPRFWQE
ncbi:MAG: hypothetical protein ACM3IJ_00355 [Candidatus Levyibacteriota bacterium]